MRTHLHNSQLELTLHPILMPRILRRLASDTTHVSDSEPVREARCRARDNSRSSSSDDSSAPNSPLPRHTPLSAVSNTMVDAARRPERTFDSRLSGIEQDLSEIQQRLKGEKRKRDSPVSTATASTPRPKRARLMRDQLVGPNSPLPDGQHSGTGRNGPLVERESAAMQHPFAPSPWEQNLEQLKYIQQCLLHFATAGFTSSSSRNEWVSEDLAHNSPCFIPRPGLTRNSSTDRCPSEAAYTCHKHDCLCLGTGVFGLSSRIFGSLDLWDNALHLAEFFCLDFGAGMLVNIF
ncbi:hypothetical protein C8R43DRAFT_1102813 [Mycena crocata]|nr:hypothetical protein C8R43DRAFT_1102813 [Mycena crocata]